MGCPAQCGRSPAVAHLALPVIGTTLTGQEIRLGGFSGLHFEGIDKKTGRYRFITNTDRGPNGEPTGINRPFLLPEFTPEIVRFELDRNYGEPFYIGLSEVQFDDWPPASNPSTVPEPGSLLMVGFGLASIRAWKRRCD